MTTDGNLLRALVHELRNCIAPLVNAVYLIRLRGGSDPELSSILAIIERQIAAMTRTMDAIVDADMLQRGEVSTRPVPLAQDSAQRRILVADDNEAMRNSFAAILRELGHEVRLAVDGVQAQEIAASWAPEFVILDVHMPKLNGYDVARRLRARFPAEAMRLVMMSGTDLDQTTLRAAKEAGFDHCIDKTLAVRGIEALLRGEEPSLA